MLLFPSHLPSILLTHSASNWVWTTSRPPRLSSESSAVVETTAVCYFRHARQYVCYLPSSSAAPRSLVLCELYWWGRCDSDGTSWVRWWRPVGIYSQLPGPSPRSAVADWGRWRLRQAYTALVGSPSFVCLALFFLSYSISCSCCYPSRPAPSRLSHVPWHAAMVSPWGFALCLSHAPALCHPITASGASAGLTSARFLSQLLMLPSPWFESILFLLPIQERLWCVIIELFMCLYYLTWLWTAGDKGCLLCFSSPSRHLMYNSALIT